MSGDLKAPFPWFGGKRRVADVVWQRFGEVRNYVEPFFGSGAVLLGRPNPSGVETVNDLDGFVSNFWRATKHKPDELAEWASNPVNENDLHARHVWLLERRASLRPRLEADPDWCDAQIAGWWVWGLCCWISAGWCSGNGPWHVVDGQLVDAGARGGVKRQPPHLGNAGQGINRQLPNIDGRHHGRGVLRDSMRSNLSAVFAVLSARLASVRVCSGDWSRICGPSVTFNHGMTAIFLDPPYADTADRNANLYVEDSESVAHDVRAWAIENGRRKDVRIALCGYEGEHVMPSDWQVYAWKAPGGFSSRAAERSGNEKRERIWFSPSCLRPEARQRSLGL